MWAYEANFYQIYPLGMTGAPFENDGVLEHRILKVIDFIPHLKKLNIDAVYFSPLFESDTHGYNTRDYRLIDKRLGTNDDFKKVCDALHKEGIKVVLDGVFNHVGRGFYGFKDVQEKKWDSEYKDWFNLSFDGNSNYNDGFWYEGWEGNYDLVKLNLKNSAVTDYLIDSVRFWVENFDIDGLRLDVAYMVDRDFLKRLRWETSNMKEDFFLVGETLFGDYNQIMNDEMCHSVTNYECYKGIHSALNSYNMFEIVHSLKRQFGPEQWTLYKGKHLFSFVDNHDVGRIASVLDNPYHILAAYGMIYGMPGIPIIYYGSEWGIEGKKSDGDPALRPSVDKPEWNELTDFISRLAKIHKESKALQYGDFSDIVLTNKQCVFKRECDGERILVLINIEENSFFAGFDMGVSKAFDLMAEKEVQLNGGFEMAPYSVYFIRL